MKKVNVVSVIMSSSLSLRCLVILTFLADASMDVPRRYGTVYFFFIGKQVI